MPPLEIWEVILMRNAGRPYYYVLDQLPYAREESFVDASSSWGLGAFQGKRVFSVSESRHSYFSLRVQDLLAIEHEARSTHFASYRV